MRLMMICGLALMMLQACDMAKETPESDDSARSTASEKTGLSDAGQSVEAGLTQTQNDLLEQFYGWVETGISERTAYGAPWQQNLDYLGKLIDEAETPFEQELFNRAMREQYGRLIYPFSTQSVIDLYRSQGVTISEADAEAIHPGIGTFAFEADEENTEWLKAELEKRDDQWWTISEFDEQVSRHVWLLTQHADQEHLDT